MFARLTACTGANPELICRFYEFGYLDIVYPDKNLTELILFSYRDEKSLKTFHKNPIFVKFHTIPPEKDEVSSIQYHTISLIQVGYITKHFELNIEPMRKFEPFRFNESWVNYRRTSQALPVTCQGDRLYASGERSLYSGPNLIISTKENIQGVYDDDFLKLYFNLSLVISKEHQLLLRNSLNLSKKKTDRHNYRWLRFCHLKDKCKARIWPTLILSYLIYPETQSLNSFELYSAIAHLM